MEVDLVSHINKYALNYFGENYNNNYLLFKTIQLYTNKWLSLNRNTFFKP